MEARAATDLWTGLAVRGILAILFGIAAVFWPSITLGVLIYLFGGFILASGLVSLIGGLANLYNGDSSFLSRVLLVILGVLEIGVGVYLLRHPLISLKTFILLVAFALIVRGVIDIFSGLFEARGAMQKLVMVVSGLLAGIAGVILLFQPVSGGVAFVWILGLYALITGPLLVALALDIKNHVVPELGNKRAR